MIALIEGKLLKIEDEKALIKLGDIGYEVMLAGYTIGALADEIGNNVTLCTMQYYEGTPGGGNLFPKLVGFLTTAEREFFQEFTSVKGIGIRKGLKCLSMPVANIAAAIEQGDEKTLKMLPGIGKRMAQQIIASLQGRVEGFTEGVVFAQKDEKQEFSDFQKEALEILIAWGEKRNEAMEFIQLTCEKHPEVTTAEELVPLVYKTKQGIEI